MSRCAQLVPLREFAEEGRGMAGIFDRKRPARRRCHRGALAPIGDVAFQHCPVLIINRHGPERFGHGLTRRHQRGSQCLIIAEDAGAVMAKAR
jgi:hypothetical protein